MELWVTLHDLNGNITNYEISNYGRVRNAFTQYILKLGTINSGYQIAVYQQRPRKRELVHRIVARHFCEGYKDNLDVNHIDGNKLNNHATNLEWVTRKENIHHNMTRGVFNIITAQQVAKVKNCKPINQYTLDGTFLKQYPSVLAAKKAGYTKAGVCANGQRPQAKGYLWRWVTKDDDIV